MRSELSDLSLTPTERSIYFLSFVTRCLLGLSAWWISQYTDLSLAGDAVTYEGAGAQIAQEWIANGSSSTLASWMGGYQAWGIVFFLACLSFLMGGVRALPVLIILFTLITALTPVLTYKIARRLEISHTAAMSAARLVIFSPVFAFWAGALYKEGLIHLVLNLMVYQILMLQESVRLRSVVILAVSISFLAALRFYLPVLLILSIGVGLLMYRRQHTESAGTGLLRNTIIFVSFVIVLVFTGFNKNLSAVLRHTSGDLLQQIQISRMDLASTNSGYLRGADVSTPEGALKFMPKGIVYFLTVPWPWQWSSWRNNLVIPEMMLWLCLYPSIFSGMKTGLRKNHRATLLLISMTMAMTCFYGLFIGNVGTAYRMRAQVWLLWMPFFAWSRDKKCQETLEHASNKREAYASRNASGKPILEAENVASWEGLTQSQGLKPTAHQ